MDQTLKKLRNYNISATALRTTSRKAGHEDVTSWVTDRQFVADSVGIPRSLVVEDSMKFNLLCKELVLNEEIVARFTRPEITGFLRFPEPMTMHAGAAVMFSKASYPMEDQHEEVMHFDTPIHAIHIFIDDPNNRCGNDMENEWVDSLIRFLAYHCSVYLYAPSGATAITAASSEYSRWSVME